jgi:EmrB/QacA subfamily drug resistance transporter
MEHLNIKKKITIMIAVMAVLLFAALNMTIVGTALPKIVNKIGGMDYFNWVFTIYMLTSSITAILVGKLSDIYGRKVFILVGIGIFILGSLLSGFSANIFQLITFRGIQGFGGGLVMSTAFATVGDLFSPRERGKWQGLLGATFGLASLFGPTLGGYIVDNLAWSWVFWVFLPFGIAAFVLIWKLYPHTAQQEKEPVDYLGSLVLSIAIITMLLGFSWADVKYPWLSPEIIGLFTISVISVVAFIFIEKRVKSPVIPLYLFKNGIFSISNIVTFFIGMGMFGIIMYVPFFAQGVLGTSATVSGLIEMAMTIAMVAASAIAGALITKTGKYKLLAIVGLVIMAAGIFLNSLLHVDSTILRLIINLIITGIGLGITFPVFTLTVQNSVKHKYLGVATATSQLSRELGGTVGVAVMGAIMSSMMMNKLTATMPAQPAAADGKMMDPAAGAALEELQDPQVLMDIDKLDTMRASLPEQMQGFFDSFVATIREALSYSLTGVFLFSAIMVAVAVVFTLFLKEIPLRTTNEEPEDEQAG